MMNTKMKIIIAGNFSDERDELIAEIYYDDEQWAGLSDLGLSLTIYPRTDGKPWVFGYEEAFEAIQKARASLFSRDNPK
jgi:hypothetical protein